ncbi:MAG: hypothetical protein JNK02_17940 [Planctomycetes bacterium]|nr:hypothetical protein [Planctomycetota bacterium]
MPAVCETREDAGDPRLRPLRVAIRPEAVFAAAREMVDDLGWEVIASEVGPRVLTCRKRVGLLGGTATITIRCEGPDEIPSTTVHVRCVSAGALLPRDRATLLEFLTPFGRRVC